MSNPYTENTSTIRQLSRLVRVSITEGTQRVHQMRCDFSGVDSVFKHFYKPDEVVLVNVKAWRENKSPVIRMKCVADEVWIVELSVLIVRGTRNATKRLRGKGELTPNGEWARNWHVGDSGWSLALKLEKSNRYESQYSSRVFDLFLLLLQSVGSSNFIFKGRRRTSGIWSSD